MSGLDGLVDLIGSAPTHPLREFLSHLFNVIQVDHPAKIITDRIAGVDRLLSGATCESLARPIQQRLYAIFDAAAGGIAELDNLARLVREREVFNLLPTDLDVFKIIVVTADGIRAWPSSLSRGLVDQILAEICESSGSARMYTSMRDAIQGPAEWYKNWDRLAPEGQFRFCVELLRFRYQVNVARASTEGRPNTRWPRPCPPTHEDLAAIGSSDHTIVNFTPEQRHIAQRELAERFPAILSEPPSGAPVAQRLNSRTPNHRLHEGPLRSHVPFQYVATARPARAPAPHIFGNQSSCPVPLAEPNHPIFPPACYAPGFHTVPASGYHNPPPIFDPRTTATQSLGSQVGFPHDRSLPYANQHGDLRNSVPLDQWQYGDSYGPSGSQ